MQRLAIRLSNYLNRMYAKSQDKNELHTRNIELINGEAVNFKGISSSDLPNHISTRQPIFSLVLQFFTRTGILLFLIFNIIGYSIIDDSHEYKSIDNFIIPFVVNGIVYSANTIYFEYQKYAEDQRVNRRKATIFQKIRKLHQKKNHQPDGDQIKNDFKLQSTEQPPNVKQSHPGKTDLKGPVIGSFQEREKSKFYQQAYHQPQSVPIILESQKVPIFVTTSWDKLQVGDVIVLQKNEICPADVLILESSQDHCIANPVHFSGTTTDFAKMASILTSIPRLHQFKGNAFEYRLMISGTVIYDRENSDSPVMGMVRLKNDPQSVDFGKINMLFREQILQSCDYVYALVLYAGKSTRYYQRVPLQRKQKSFFLKKVDRFYQFTAILLILVTLASWFIDSLTYTWSLYRLGFLLLLYVNFMPFYLYAVLDLVSLLSAVYKKRQFYNNEQKEDSKQKLNHEFIVKESRQQALYYPVNQTQLADLSLIDSVIFDKTGTLTVPKFKIRMVFINETLFEINHKTFKDQSYWKGFQKEIVDNLEQQIQEESDSFQKQISSVKVSPVNKPMSPSKRTSLIPWKLEENLINCEPNGADDQFGETSNQDEANFNPADFADDHPRLNDIHRCKIPRVFQQPLWTSEFDFVQPLQSSGGRQSPHRKQSERPPKIETIEPRKKLSADRNFGKPITDDLKKENPDLLFTEKDIFVRTVRWEAKEPYLDALLAMALCHDSFSKFIRQDDVIRNEHASHLDQLQVQLANNYGYKFVCATQQRNHYILEINDQLIDFPVSVSRISNYRFSVIRESSTQQKSLDFSSEEEPTYVQFIREDGLELYNSLAIDKDEKEAWESLIVKFQVKGCRPVLYFKSTMNRQEQQAFNRNPEAELMNKARSFELVMILGVAEKIKKSAETVIKSLASADIGIWVASGDSLEKVLPIVYKAQIISPKGPIMHLMDGEDLQTQIQQQIQLIYNNQIKQLKDGNSDRTTLERQPSPNPANKRKSVSVGRRTSTRAVLPGISTQLQRITGSALLISGAALEKIFSNENLKKHLCFLVSFCYSVVGYRMDKAQKSMLVSIQKLQLYDRRILAIGDEWNDSMMMNQASYCLQFSSQRQLQITTIERLEHLIRAKRERHHSRPNVLKQSQCLNRHTYTDVATVSVADLVIKDFDDLLRLVFLESMQSAEFIDNLITFSFYRCHLICYWAFLQIAIKTQLVIPPFRLWQSLIYFAGCSALFYISLPNKKEPVSIRDQLVYLFLQNHINFRRTRYLQYFSKIFFYPQTEAIILVLLQTQILYQAGEGQQISENMLNFQAFAIILFFELLKLLQHTNLFLGILLVISYSLLAMLSFLDYFNDLKEQFSFIITHQSFFAIVFLSSMSYLFNKLIIQFWNFFQKQEVISKSDKREVLEKMQAIQILYATSNREKYSPLLQISKLVLKLFKSEEEIDSTIRMMVSGMAISEKTKKINRLTQQFENVQLELKYQLSQLPSIFEYYRLYYPLSWMLVEGAMLVQLWMNVSYYSYSWILYLSFSYNGLQVMIALMIYTKAFKKYHFRISKLLICSRLIYKILYDIYFFQDNNTNMNDMLMMQLFMLQPLIDDRPLTMILYCFALAISFVIRFSDNNTTNDDSINNYITLNYYLICLMQCALSSGLHGTSQRNYREEYIQLLVLQQNTTLKQDTLSILMPKFIRNIINQKGEYEVSEHQGEVAILFCDICQFDTIIKVQQQNVVSILDTLFRHYDSLCNQYGLQKIETVGKTYMAAAGLRHVNALANVNPVLRTLQVAMEMRKFAQSQSFCQTEKIIVKIGVHYGDVIAGVIGDHKPQFSLIGDTINTTSRVCSTAQDGQIKISSQAFRQVSSHTEFIFTQDSVEAKGKGIIDTYIVNKQEKQEHKIRVPKQYREEQSQKIIYQKHQDEIIQRNRRSIFEFRASKKPSLIVPSIKVMNPNQATVHQHRSSINLDKGETPKHSHGDSEHNQHDRPRTLEGQNIIEVIELKLSKDGAITVDEAPEVPLYEIDREKLKLLHASEEEFKEEDILILDRQMLYLDFDPDVDEDLIDQFYEQLSVQNRTLIILLKISVSILIIIYNSSTFLIESAFYRYELWVVNVVFGYLLAAMMVLFVVALANKQTRDHFLKQKYFISSYLCAIAWWILHIFSTNKKVIGENLIALGIFLSFLTQLNPLIRIKYKILESAFLITINVVVIVVKEWEHTLIYYAILLQVIFFTNQYYKFYKQVESFNTNHKLQAKHAHLDQLVKHQLPSHMLEQFLQNQHGKVVLKDMHENVTLLFADIAGFTEYSSKVPPDQVVFMLRNLFTEFDRQCQAKNCYKLYTIGDCYVLMGMVDAKDRNPALEAKNVVEMGFQMIDIIKGVREKVHFTTLDMRIGVHTGKIIGGVLGTDIVRYDIYGPDVLIANKMESKGVSGHVQISQQTKDILEMCYADEFQYHYKVTVEVPSIDRKTDGYLINVKTSFEPSFDLLNQEQMD